MVESYFVIESLVTPSGVSYCIATLGDEDDVAGRWRDGVKNPHLVLGFYSSPKTLKP
jgi:hypothetical protein